MQINDSVARSGFGRYLVPLIAFALLTLTQAFAAPSPPPIATPASVDLPPDIRRIVERGELVVAMPATDAPPFFYVKEGRMQGIDVELARGLAQELKVGVRFHRGAASFNEVVNVVGRGEADIAICKLSRTILRARTIRFSDPYLTLRHVLALNRVRFADISRGRHATEVVRNFTGSVGVIAGSSYAEFAHQNFPRAKVVQFSAWDDVVAAVKRGEIDAAYRDEFEIKRLMKIDPRNALVLRTVTLTDTSDSLGMALAAGSHQLLGVVNLFLAQRPDKLSVDRILREVDATTSHE